MRYVLCLLVGVAAGSLAVYFALNQPPKKNPETKAEEPTKEITVQHKREEMDGVDTFATSTVLVKGNDGKYGVWGMVRKRGKTSYAEINIEPERGNSFGRFKRIRIKTGVEMLIDANDESAGGATVRLTKEQLSRILVSDSVLVNVNTAEFYIDDNAKRVIKKTKEILEQP